MAQERKILLIGLCEDFQEIESSSKVYLIDLEGVNLTSIEKLSDRNKMDLVSTFIKVHKRAMQNFEVDLTVILTANCETDTASTFIDSNMSNSILVNAFFYKLGYEMMYERITSTRINDYTLLSKEEATIMKNIYKGKYEKRLKDLEMLYFNKGRQGSFGRRNDLP